MINEIQSVSHVQIMMGIIFIGIGLMMFYYTFEGSKKIEKDDHIRILFRNRKYTGAIIFFIGGVYLLIKEIIKII